MGIRIDADLEERLQNIQDQTGVEKATIARECIKAAVEYVERTGKLTFPLRIVDN